jgi:Tfp pilus assembly protein PilV
MKFSSTSTKGYSLVEVLVAVSILMLSIVGPLTIAMKSLQSAQYARQQNTAFFLAQEGITIINTVRNNAALAVYTGATNDSWQWPQSSGVWACHFEPGCNIDFRDSLLDNNI